MQNERLVKAKVKEKLKSHSKVTWWFMPLGTNLGRSGIPDFIGCVNGNMFAIETKSGKNDLTANQLRETQLLVQAGAKVWIVRELSLDSFMVEFDAWVALCS
jgi:hypothetical protein